MKNRLLFSIIFLGHTLLGNCNIIFIDEKPNIAFISTNIRIVEGQEIQSNLENFSQKKAWKGEKVSFQLLISCHADIAKLIFKSSPLISENGNKIKNITISYVDLVETDNFGISCGAHKINQFDSAMVADILDNRSFTKITANKPQAVWISINIPETASTGIYKATISTNYGQNLNYQINVLAKTLPKPANWAYDLDLWQHPAAIARMHNVPVWSAQHYKLMKPYYTMLAADGQKNITTSIINEPWHHQTFDDYPSLIKWVKKKDNKWYYDYTLFDQYVTFVMACGINKRFNCYTMIPWGLQFEYFDEIENKNVTFQTKTSSEEYRVFWKTMLIDFTKHLKAKNWFNITSISVDERPMEDMKNAIKVLKTVDKNWKITLAGDYHPEIEKDIYDYSLALRLNFDETVLARRKAENMPSTFYTCCAEAFPNGFTYSPPAESIWLSWHAASQGLTGCLRWAYNSWTVKPLADARYTAFPAGDTFQIYPGPKSSIRFEKLIEGIQDFEKIRILKADFAKNNNQSKLSELNILLNTFNIKTLKNTDVLPAIETGQEFINNF